MPYCDDKNSVDLERDGNGNVARKGSCPSDTDSCPSDTDSCPSDSTGEEEGELPEMKKFSPPKPQLHRRKSSIQKMIDLVLEKGEEVSYVLFQWHNIVQLKVIGK